jgi:hypothetical protein
VVFINVACSSNLQRLIKTFGSRYTWDTSVVKQITTVKVKPETKKMLAELGKKEDTYD